jgi:hypothetical protein
MDLRAVSNAVSVGIRVEEVDEAVSVKVQVPVVPPEFKLLPVGEGVPVGIFVFRVCTGSVYLVDVRKAVSIGIGFGEILEDLIRKAAFRFIGIVGGDGKIIGVALFKVGDGAAGIGADIDAVGVIGAGGAVVDAIAGRFDIGRIPNEVRLGGRCEGAG